MAKVMLVEDDNNLREIYEARLQAEGYTIISAQDGEEALVIAKKEKPDLIISDVMMPKISGFEMLDILRNTDGLKDVKIIMLTALGQSEDKTRADQLGANKYLVKSQVTLEDIVKTAHQLLDDGDGSATAAAAPDQVVTTQPVAVAPAPTAAPAPVAPAAPVTPTPTIPVASAPEPVTVPPTPAPVAVPTPAPTPPVVTAPSVVAPAPVATAPSAPDLSVGETTTQEQAEMKKQIDQFATAPVVTPSVPTSIPVTSADNASSDQKLVSTAVDSLVANAPAQKPSDVTAVEVPHASAPTVTPPSAPPTPVAMAPAVVTPTNEADNVTIAHKKIIEPLNDLSKTKSSDNLNALLAKETSNTPVAAPTSAVVNPTTSPAAQPEPGPEVIDPNSIAL